MVAWRIATLWLLLIAPAVASASRDEDEHGVTYLVVGDDLELMTEPNDSAYSTGRLGRGNKVLVLATQPGWARVRTPIDNFHWINSAEIGEQADGTFLVTKRQASVRHASATARLPGPPLRTIKKGTVVRLLDHPDLQVNAGGQSQIWRAIEATGDEDRFLRLAGLAVDLPRPDPARLGAIDQNPIERPERTVSFEPETDNPDLPPEVNAELASIAAMTRSIKAAPVDSWNLDPVRGRYESLLRQFGSNLQVKAVIEPRLDRTQRELELVQSAQKFARLLKEGDERDSRVVQLQRATATARARTERNFDAQGFLQPSSRRSQGQKVLALIGPEGRPSCYLSIPPGVPVNQYLARKVGVRGIVHFDEDLGARLISVRDLESLEK